MYSWLKFCFLHIDIFLYSCEEAALEGQKGFTKKMEFSISWERSPLSEIMEYIFFILFYMWSHRYATDESARMKHGVWL